MHECPDCGHACDCDGEDVWNDDLQTYLFCTHQCERFDDDDIDDYVPPEERLEDLSLNARQPEQRNDADSSIPAATNNSTMMECGNCGVPRFVHDGALEKCPNCGDDEFDLSLMGDAP